MSFARVHLGSKLGSSSRRGFYFLMAKVIKRNASHTSSVEDAHLWRLRGSHVRPPELINDVFLSTVPALPTKSHSSYNQRELLGRTRDQFFSLVSPSLSSSQTTRELQLLCPWPISSPSYVVWFYRKSTSFEPTVHMDARPWASYLISVLGFTWHLSVRVLYSCIPKDPVTSSGTLSSFKFY